MMECKQTEDALPAVQEEQRGLAQELKALLEQEHALQKDALGVRLRVEQIDAAIAEHHNKIKHWHREAGKISLHTVDEQPAAALPALSPDALQAGPDPSTINTKIALLEARCEQVKPNLGAIAEYRKKEALYLQRVEELDDITTQRDGFKRGCEDLRKQRLNEFMAGFNIITNKLKENYQMLTLGATLS
ncbi:hypothetical protein COCON_G00184450 [Conger conger]|uniref:Uncharacterized protein n=1 Tax=Conger conger TaxID=82655 RepID=A0A9Q1HQW0_CONCO|nr:hypothetical protein COCON_G00184450 [Conger conger]